MSSINRASGLGPIFSSDIFSRTTQNSAAASNAPADSAELQLGNILGSALGSGGVNSQQFLDAQAKIQAEQREFELQSTLLKVRHDMCMSAIRNMK